jgi:hypothetical protein
MGEGYCDALLAFAFCYLDDPRLDRSTGCAEVSTDLNEYCAAVALAEDQGCPVCGPGFRCGTQVERGAFGDTDHGDLAVQLDLLPPRCGASGSGGLGEAGTDDLDVTVVARGRYSGSYGRVDSTAAHGGRNEAYVNQVDQ